MNGDRARRLGRRGVAALSGIALLAVPAFSLALRDLWPGLGRPLSDQHLAAIRGGFTTTGGVQFSFGIERTVTIDGATVAITRLVLDNLQNLLTGTVTAAQFGTTILTVVQNGTGNSVGQSGPAASMAAVAGATLTGAVPPSTAPVQSASTIPAPTATSPSIQAAAAAPAAAPTQTVQSTPAAAPIQTVQPVTPTTTATQTVQPGTVTQTVQPVTPTAAPTQTAPPAASTAPTQTAQPAASAAPTQAAQPAAPAASAAAAPLVLQITVNGQVIQLPNAAGIGLVVQNSVNNSQISTRTQIDATLSSLSLLQSGQFAAALRQQILGSVRP